MSAAFSLMVKLIRLLNYQSKSVVKANSNKSEDTLYETIFLIVFILLGSIGF